MTLIYGITELGKNEVRDPKSVYFKNIPKNTLEKMEDVIDKVLKEGDKKI